MKRLCILAGFLGASALAAQRGHHLGSVVLDFNTGIEAFNSTNYYKLAGPDGLRDTSINADAGSANGSVGLEIGIGRFVGIGVRGKTSYFFRSLDAVMNSRPDVHSNDLLLMLNLHPLPFKRFDLVLGSELGVSKLIFDVNDLYQTMITGKGGYFAIHVSPRFYLKRFGFNLKASLPVFSYNDLRHSSDSSDYLLSRWKASGIGVSMGVQYRFF